MSTDGDIEVNNAPVKQEATQSRESTVSAQDVPLIPEQKPEDQAPSSQQREPQQSATNPVSPPVSAPTPTPAPIQASTTVLPTTTQPNSSTQSPQLKQEEISSRNTPVPQVLQFQVPSDTKVSDIVGGAPVRQWLNENVTPTLLEGVRKISTER